MVDVWERASEKKRKKIFAAISLTFAFSFIENIRETACTDTIYIFFNIK